MTYVKQLPANVDAERSILGAILCDNKTYLETGEKLHSWDFSLDSHRRIYGRIADLIESNRPVDMITLVEELERRKELQTVGDVGYLTSLIVGMPDRPSIAHYVDIVKDKAMLRGLISACNTTIALASDQSATALPIMADLEDALLQIGGKPQMQAKPLRDVLARVLNDIRGAICYKRRPARLPDC